MAASSPLPNLAEIRLPSWLGGMLPPAAPASDSDCMDFAIRIARESLEHGGGPFGAAVREEASGLVIAAGVNMSLSSGNPLLHAEAVALCLAGGRPAGSGAISLFCSCEPCIMCLGAAHWAEVGRIVSAAGRQDALSLGLSEGAGVSELRAEMAGRGVVFQDGFHAEAGLEVLGACARRGGIIYGPRA